MTSWQIISQSYARYVGIPQFCLGMLGNLMNIWIFAGEPAYRKVPCAFYLLMASIVGSILLLGGQISRFLILGFNDDLTRTSILWCKTRQFLISVISAVGMTFQCLATIDQYLVTSRSVRLRQLSNIKLAYCIAISITIIWILQGIPFLIFNEIK